jgi:hypothetical protein
MRKRTTARGYSSKHSNGLEHTRVSVSFWSCCSSGVLIRPSSFSTAVFGSAEHLFRTDIHIPEAEHCPSNHTTTFYNHVLDSYHRVVRQDRSASTRSKNACMRLLRRPLNIHSLNTRFPIFPLPRLLHTRMHLSYVLLHLEWGGMGRPIGRGHDSFGSTLRG